MPLPIIPAGGTPPLPPPVGAVFSTWRFAAYGLRGSNWEGGFEAFALGFPLDGFDGIEGIESSQPVEWTTEIEIAEGPISPGSPLPGDVPTSGWMKLADINPFVSPSSTTVEIAAPIPPGTPEEIPQAGPVWIKWKFVDSVEGATTYAVIVLANGLQTSIEDDEPLDGWVALRTGYDWHGGFKPFSVPAPPPAPDLDTAEVYALWDFIAGDRPPVASSEYVTLTPTPVPTLTDLTVKATTSKMTPLAAESTYDAAGASVTVIRTDTAGSGTVNITGDAFDSLSVTLGVGEQRTLTAPAGGSIAVRIDTGSGVTADVIEVAAE